MNLALNRGKSEELASDNTAFSSKEPETQCWMNDEHVFWNVPQQQNWQQPNEYFFAFLSFFKCNKFSFELQK